LVEAQSRGALSLTTSVGSGTFVDPRIGAGTTLVSGTGLSLAQTDGDKLRYEVPPIDIALFAASSADADGNLYMNSASLLTESREAALAARLHGGKVIVTVAEIVAQPVGEIFLPAAAVDAIVVCPRNEQVGSVKQLKHWPMFEPGQTIDVREAEEEVEFINRLIGITPRRGAVDLALARRAAALLVRTSTPGSRINIGVGLPEEVCRLIVEAGLLDEVTFLVETGVYGGLPAPGVFFGAAIRPQKFLSSAAMFRFMEQNLDIAVLGFLQVDAFGNVNVSKRGAGPRGYVGPGGFIDVSSAAKTVIFVGSSMAGGKATLEGDQLHISERGRPKLVPKVDEVTFSGEEALKRGQDVWYVTTIGTLHLTRRGMELVEIVPGLDLERDVLKATAMQIVLPESGEVPVAGSAVVTGRGLSLRWTDDVEARASA
jgi:propionate CoA-transferase